MVGSWNEPWAWREKTWVPFLALRFYLNICSLLPSDSHGQHEDSSSEAGGTFVRAPDSLQSAAQM